MRFKYGSIFWKIKIWWQKTDHFKFFIAACVMAALFWGLAAFVYRDIQKTKHQKLWMERQRIECKEAVEKFKNKN